MDANERELVLRDEVFAIVGAAMEVSNELGCGFLLRPFASIRGSVALQHLTTPGDSP